jgi:hypothetical protein
LSASVVRVRDGRRDEPGRTLEPGRSEIVVFSAVPVDVEDAGVLGGLDRVGIEIEHDEGHAGLSELAADLASNTAVAADDVVIFQVLDRSAPLALGPRAGQHAAGDHLHDRTRDVQEDCHAREQEDHREDLRPSSSRRACEPGQRHGDDRAIERSDPPFAEGVVEDDGPDPEHQCESRERDEKAAHAEDVFHGGSIGHVDEDGRERQLNIHLDPENLAGVYANFANISFSDYEFTLTFARIDHEVEEGDIPGVVVTRVNVSARFMKELLDAMTDSWSKWTTREGIKNLPEAPPRDS